MTDAAAAAPGLLNTGDPPVFTVVNEGSRSPFVLLADHAGRSIPGALGQLGLPQPEIDRHIGWDIGIDGVALRLAQRLGAFAILQNYSRLVIDCNRPPDAASAIPAVSDGTVVPGNQGLGEDERSARREAIFDPYHERIARELNQREREGQPAVLVALHSFTPVMNGQGRAWHAGVLYQRDARLAHALLAALRAEPGLVVGDNEPYFVSDATDYAIPVHGERRGLPHVELEIRQDLIADGDGQQAWAERLQRLLPASLLAL